MQFERGMLGGKLRGGRDGGRGVGEDDDEGRGSAGGSIVAANVPDKSTLDPETCQLYATSDGTVGMLGRVGPKDFRFMDLLQRSMGNVLRPVGGFRWDEFRAFRTDTRTGKLGGKLFIDGDFCESFLDLSAKEMQIVVDDMKRGNWWDRYVLKHARGDADAAAAADKDLTVEFVCNYVSAIKALHG